jgi:hypothetical protein
MATTRIVVESIAGLGILGALFFAGWSFKANQGVAYVPYNNKNAPGNSPVKVVGGSISFRANGGWTTTDGITWTTNNNVDTSVIDLERVSLMNVKGELDNITLGHLGGSLSIEVDGRKPDGTTGSNGVLVSLSSGKVVITPTNSAVVGFYFNIVSGKKVGDAPTWDSMAYPGVRYKDQSSGCTQPPTGQPNAGPLCESISQIKISIGGGTTQTFSCPDGECRVNIGPPS